MSEREGELGGAADQRREQMLRAALEIIAERGFPETRIADVAERAGVSPALVIYYFKTKDGLLTEAMRLGEDTWYDVVARRMKTADTTAARLEEIVAMTCLPEDNAELPDSWALWLDLWAQAVRHPEVAKVRQEFDVHWRETIRTVVCEGQAHNEFRDTDAEDFAVAFSAMLDGFAIQIALHDPFVDARRAFELSIRVAAQHLGFAWEPGRRSGAPRRRRRPPRT